jgi:hypothetical protein
MQQPDGHFHTPPELGWGTITRGELGLRIILNAVAGLVIVSLLVFFRGDWLACVASARTDAADGLAEIDRSRR